MATRGWKIANGKSISICSLLLICFVNATISASLHMAEDMQTDPVKIVHKRSPISIVFDHGPEDLSSHSSEHQLPLSIKTSEPRAPPVSGSAVINLVDHQIIQTHEHQSKLHVLDDIPAISVIHAAPAHAVSSSSKTTITTNVGHVIDEKGITPIVTHDISHVHESVAHIKDDEEHLRVLPLHAIVPTTREPEHLITVHHRESKTQSHNSISSKEYQRKHIRRNIYREPIGGYGVGWRYGGHGAGHGFYVIS